MKKRITPNQYKFLCYLSRNPTGSIHHLGKSIFTTEVSIYKAINNLDSNKLIKIEQVGKYIQVTITKKGSNFITEKFDDYSKLPKHL